MINNIRKRKGDFIASTLSLGDNNTKESKGDCMNGSSIYKVQLLKLYKNNLNFILLHASYT